MKADGDEDGARRRRRQLQLTRRGMPRDRRAYKRMTATAAPWA